MILPILEIVGIRKRGKKPRGCQQTRGVDDQESINLGVGN